MKEYQKYYYIIYEPYLSKVYENPIRFNPSLGVDSYFRYLDRVDIKRCSFEAEKTARRKLEVLRKHYLEEKKTKQGYRKHLLVGDDTPQGLHMPDQKEFEQEILSIFDRHYVIKKLRTSIAIEE